MFYSKLKDVNLALSIEHYFFIDCSDNGRPQLGPNCGAYCDCFGGWEGEYCEVISARGGGDPHLETLDG